MKQVLVEVHTFRFLEVFLNVHAQHRFTAVAVLGCQPSPDEGNSGPCSSYS